MSTLYNELSQIMPIMISVTKLRTVSIENNKKIQMYCNF